MLPLNNLNLLSQC